MRHLVQYDSAESSVKLLCFGEQRVHFNISVLIIRGFIPYFNIYVLIILDLSFSYSTDRSV